MTLFFSFFFFLLLPTALTADAKRFSCLSRFILLHSLSPAGCPMERRMARFFTGNRVDLQRKIESLIRKKGIVRVDSNLIDLEVTFI